MVYRDRVRKCELNVTIATTMTIYTVAPLEIPWDAPLPVGYG